MELPCIVERVTWKNDNFAIMACNLDPYSKKYNKSLKDVVRPYINKQWKSFTVALESHSVDEIVEAGSYMFVGEFVNDPKRGPQYKSCGFYNELPETINQMKLFLESLPNIKSSRSEEILRRFSLAEIPNILDNEPNRLLEVNGITVKRLKPIIEAWQKSKDKRDLYSWFIGCKIPIKLADEAYRKWKGKTKEKLSNNPYLLTELTGIGFVKADIVAHSISKDVQKEFRLESCMSFCLREDSLSNGNLCCPYSTLKKMVCETLMECDRKLGNIYDGDWYSSNIPTLIKKPNSRFNAVKDTYEDIAYVYEKNVWEKELFIGNSFYERSNAKSKYKCSDEDIDKAEKNISFFLGREIVLDPTQKDAIKSAFNNKITIITGGGGTGKSTICRCIYYLCRDKNMSINMMSPTGKAAKVLSERTGGAATTIHRGLGILPDSHLPKNIITQDLLLVDEVSMSGLDTMYHLMVAIENNPSANIVLVGDKNQLPSVSPGNFLSDLIESGAIEVVKLNRIHRQDENSYISVIANEISKGNVKEIPYNANDITWKNLNPDTLQKDLVNFLSDYLKEQKLEDIQFLSPMKKGSCGVNIVNSIIQEEIARINNSKNRYLERSFEKFYIGDRVMQITNNYEKDVFNGDIGTVIDLGEKIRDPSVSDKKQKYIKVSFIEEDIEYYGEEIDEIKLAWAITVHKFQGSQTKNVVVILSSEASIMMNKELVYTAFTRAEKHLYIFGHSQMYRLAPSRSAVKRRYTNLVNIIKEKKIDKKILRVI